MSSANKRRIKSFREWDRESRKFQDIIPFGTDGDLVDTYSNLDLEAQLLIGGFKTTRITETDEITTIIEKFYHMTRTEQDENTIIKEKDTCMYSKVTKLISQSVYGTLQGNNDDDDNESIIGDNEDDPFAIGQLLSIKDLVIEIELYLGDYDNFNEEDNSQCQLLYKKRINADNNFIEEVLI